MRINIKRMNELLHPHGLEVSTTFATKWLIQDITPKTGQPRTHGQISLLNLIGFDPRQPDDNWYVSGDIVNVVIYKTKQANLLATIMTILNVPYHRKES